MKPFLEVEKNRQAYHQDASRNTVHRTSLLAPKIAGAATCISFLNHFLIKRGYTEVMCKLTCIDMAGRAIQSSSIEIKEPRVYAINLDEFFGNASGTSQYLIEFYSHRNLFIPFPAVMVNHIGTDFTNVVHSYNRVLNDIFENDAVNKHQVSEASIDVCVNERYDTFFNFTAGPFKPAGQIEVSVCRGDSSRTANVPVDIERLTSQNFHLSDIFPGSVIEPGSVLKILQPKQDLFYGRLLSGMVDRKTGAFSANHSYYDSSDTREYFDNDHSQRIYPYFSGFLNRVTMYPVMSPGAVAVHIRLHGDGKSTDSPSQWLRSPSSDPVSFDVDTLVSEARLETCNAFEVMAVAKNGEKIPTRVMHQLSYGMRNSQSMLLSSIAVGLQNQQAFVPSYKTGFTWGQMLNLPGYASRMGLCFSDSTGAADQVDVTFYDESGEISQTSALLAPRESLVFNPTRLGGKAGDFVWFIAKSKRPDLAAQCFHAHAISHNASGEHSF